MTITIKAPDIRELKPRITVFGVGGAGGNAVNNMIRCGLAGVDFVVANTDAQALLLSQAERRIQMGIQVTEGLGAGSQPEVGRSAAEEVIDEIRDQLAHVHMAFITAGMGGGTGTGAAPVIARVAREMGILTVGVVTKPFHFEGQRRMRVAEAGIGELQKAVDTLIVIPNQNLFRIANEKTTFAEAFAMADQVLLSGVASVTDLIVKPGLINLDFADVRAVMRDMGKAMMGTGEASGENRAILAAEAAIANPLLDETSMKGARGLLISITGGADMKIYEVDEAANRIREEVDVDANVIFGATQDESLDGIIRVSVVATGLDPATIREEGGDHGATIDQRLALMADRLRAQMASRSQPAPVQPAQMQPVHVQPAPVQPVAAAPVPPQPEPVAMAHDLVVEAVQTRAAFFAQPVMEAPAPAEEPAQADEPFIPPVPERAPVRPPRMPSVDDLPRPAQAMLSASREEAVAAPPAPAEKRMTLMQRLAAVGLGVRREDEHAEPAPAAAPPAEVPAQPSATHQMYAKRPAAPAPAAAQPYRPAQGSLDAHGRVPAPTRSFEDDQLEIPAFLRRQAK
ncbi:cell division protein FtsZ [Rhabdaerophilum calidifontis]|uniref:cell division protein FtsZ n=1 Tax=Rhabdaerophilum calidifontis TaxID=2604328 RepID=UPI00123A08C0|nr:cell division protein FtsZ [Rhabdaerophilum calidifontis]